MKTNKIFIISLVTAFLITSCLTSDELNIPFKSFVPTKINDGTVISTPESENINSAELETIFRNVNENENLWSIRSLLVYRNGKLVAENYFKDENDILNRHLIWSSTKQVLGVLTGIAVNKGIIKSIDDPISDYFTTELENHPDKRNITIRDLLTMQSGIAYNNDGAGGETDKLLRQIPDNMVDFILSLPLKTEPGTEFYYKDGDPHLVSAIIQKATRKPTDDWANEVLFSKLGITNINWVRYKDGTTHGGYGIETTPRELAKIALCVADSGKWNDQQIIPSHWIKNMTTPQVETNSDYGFGYYWWLDSSRNIQFTWGHGGQFAFIVPSKNLVVVITSFPNTQGDYQISAGEALPVVDKIVAASN